jgi:DNA polymerase III subunit chi
MPRVEFHSGIADGVHFACRLLRKAWRQGARVLVSAPAQTLTVLDRELWSFEAAEFVPHCRVRGDQGIDRSLRLTPIWLCEGEGPRPGPAVWLNLGVPLPADPDRFERVIEIVPEGDEARRAARARWREYEVRGIAVQHHAHGTG